MSLGSERGKAETDLVRARAELLKLATDAVSQDRWRRWRPWLDSLLLAVFVVLMTALFAPPIPGQQPVPPVDSVAPSTVRAERDVLVEDAHATELRRREAASSVLAVFDYDSELYFNLGDRVAKAVASMAERRGKAAEEAGARRSAFENDLGVPVSAGVFALIEELADPFDLVVAINFFLNLGLDRMIVANRAELPENRSIEVRDLGYGRSIRPGQLGAILDLRQFRRLIQAHAGDAPYGGARIVRTWIIDTAVQLANANLRANETLTRQRIEAAVAEVDAVFVRIRAGEILVRRGDRVTPQMQSRIRLLNRGVETRAIWTETVAVGLLLTGVVLLAGIFFRRGRVPHRLDRKQVIMTLAISGAAAALSVGMFHAGRGLADGLGLGPDVAAYFVPLALGTTLVALLVDARTSLLVGIGLTLLVAYRVDGGLWLVTYYIVGTLVAGIAARACRRRSDLLRAGLAVAVAQAAAVPIIVVLSGEAFGPSHLPLLAAALVSGAVLAVAALGLLPVLEHLFDEASDMRLLELTTSDHPLLKRLALVAPGSYYASLVVGNLAEAAADAIGANGLKARVMALYHDVGKAIRPGYFSENQREGNIHDRLAPETSARLIFSHVHDGLEICRKQRLGPVVLEAVARHHGTTLLRPIFAKAAAQASDAGRQIDEADFRYPGPKPASREDGILMLADSVEAATRALGNPSPPEVRRRVAEVIAARLADGQLDDCELTLRDLAAVEQAFTRTLTLGVFHNRVEYPVLPQERPGDGSDEGDDSGRPGRLPRVDSRPA